MSEPSDAMQVGAGCGICGGPIYFYACPTHEWAIASECQRCGSTHIVTDCCPDCGWNDHGLPTPPPPTPTPENEQ